MYMWEMKIGMDTSKEAQRKLCLGMLGSLGCYFRGVLAHFLETQVCFEYFLGSLIISVCSSFSPALSLHIPSRASLPHYAVLRGI